MTGDDPRRAGDGDQGDGEAPPEERVPEPDPGVDAPPDRVETRAVTGGRRLYGDSLAPPLYATSTFATDTIEESRQRALTPMVKHHYGRYGNPTVAAFEEAVAELEGAETALAFGSGMGAVSSVVLALCSKGDHIVAQRQLYAHTSLLFQAVCPRFGIEVTLVDGADTDALVDAVEPGRTVLVFTETPTNPVLQLVDLDAVGAMQAPITVVDSTFAGPVIQRPLEHGADLVLHSATKSLAGHNDATLGVVAGSRDLVQWIWGYHTIHGATPSPFDALNGVRGIRTLGVRMHQQSTTAARLAHLLEGHPAVEQVHYPGLDSHPQRDLAKRQMAMGGGVLAFEVAGGRDAGRAFCEASRLSRIAPSLGGPDTLVTQPAATTAVNLTPEELAESGITDGLVRMSVGLEHPDDLVADVLAALAAATT